MSDTNKKKGNNLENSKEIIIMQQKSKTEIVIERLNVLVSILALVLSCAAIVSSHNTAKYQVNQERLPNIICLNQELILNYKKDEYNDEIINYDAINSTDLLVHNIGVGTAQNCEVIWNMESIKEACLTAKKLFVESDTVKEYEDIDYYDLLKYKYGFEEKNGSLYSIWYYDNELGEIEENIIKDYVVKIPYMLPITVEEEIEYLPVPEPIVLMLLEMGNQEIQDAISAEFNISYQDSAGKAYNEDYIAYFKLIDIVEEETEKQCKYNVEIYKK